MQPPGLRVSRWPVTAASSSNLLARFNGQFVAGAPHDPTPQWASSRQARIEQPGNARQAHFRAHRRSHPAGCRSAK